METRDTILRLIEQTALILRAFFNQLPLEDPLQEQTIKDFSLQLKAQTGLDLDALLLLQTPEAIGNYFESLSSFDTTNQELLADLFVTTIAQQEETNPELALAYQRLALHLYQGVNQATQTYDASRQEKIRVLQMAI